MAFVEAGDIVVHHDVSGPSAAPVLMFANALGTSFHIWDDVVTCLGPEYRILRYDMRGHGLTDAPPGPYQVAQLARDGIHLLDALAIERVHLCGLSLGGLVAQQVAARFPDRVDRLILCATGLRIGTEAGWRARAEAVRHGGLEPLADELTARWFTPAFFRDHPARIRGYRNMLVRTPAEGYASACDALADADLGAAAGEIAAPTLVVHGQQDVATPASLARQTAAAIRNARLYEVKAAAHLPCVEQPRELADAVRGFLQE